MTTNQTIDGVPRELLERIAESGGYVPRRAQLRALLDAPEPVKVNRLGAHHVLGAIHNVPGFPGVKGNHIHDLAALLNGVLDESDAQPQGEPVANPVLGYADSYRAMARQGVKTVSIWSVITDLERNIAPLYAEQPAPVAVVLPERSNAVTSANVSVKQAYALGWNACLDELKRLNGGL